MKLKDKIFLGALVLMPISLIGIFFSYFIEYLYAMCFWGILLLLSATVYVILMEPHKDPHKKR